MQDAPLMYTNIVTNDEAIKIEESLYRLGLLENDKKVVIHEIPSGVSSDVWLVQLPSRTVCVKRALPKLRVRQDWFAPIERNNYEAKWLEIAFVILSGGVPKLLGHDKDAGLLVMEYLTPTQFPRWKEQLRDGNVDPSIATALGKNLVQIHNYTAGRQDIAEVFAAYHIFQATRIEPYFDATARVHSDLAQIYVDLAMELINTRLVLIHGDVSPKNILVGSSGPVILDAECACYSDPAFDLAFCLTHLLLKCIWRPNIIDQLLNCASTLVSSYLQGVNWESPVLLEKRAAKLLPAIMLARIDGKVPVEYITHEQNRNRVRLFSRSYLKKPIDRLDTIIKYWGLHARN